MILLIEDKINEIPILQVVKAENESQSLPTLVYYHGFYGEKISSLTLAYKIANLGYRVILPDALYHGDRKHHISDVDLDLSFWEIVTNNVNEFKVIKDYYIEHQLSDPQRFGVGGTSMGGITTYALLSVYPEIKAAAVLMGTAYAEDYAQKLIDEFNRLNEKQISQKEANDAIHLIRPYDLSQQIDKLNNRPLLIWHGMKDQVVPYPYSPKFYQAIESSYTTPSHLKLVSEKERSHHISRLSMAETTAWFEKFL